MNIKTSLKHRGSQLANPAHQLTVLIPGQNHRTFLATATAAKGKALSANGVEILQLNLGKMCNMACGHCHVDAGPDRREIMKLSEVQACIEVLNNHPQIHTIDLTGGAPEMNPHFRDIVQSARELDRHIIDRCNLTILMAEGFESLPEFLAENKVEIVASLPCYLEENTDAQRGTGAFAKSIQALRRLNDLGYGQAAGDLTLTLVYNPVGPHLPPNQSELEAQYRQQLGARFGISFSRLFTITNMPVSRYLEYLLRNGEYETYLQKLIDAFNPAALDGLMCRNTVSVGWDGQLYDCDFNQMLELNVGCGTATSIYEFDYELLGQRKIVTGQHCFGCTAGSGSGCQGAIT